MKKLTALVFSAVALPAVVLSTAGHAAVLYTNGAVNGTLQGFSITTFQILNDFTLTSNATITGVNFGAMDTGGDQITSVDWAIRSAPAGLVLASGTATTSDTFLFHNSSILVDVYQDSFAITATPLLAGGYFLQLENAVTIQNGLGFWDESNGLSGAFITGVGGIPSESFDILGTSDLSVPEPAAWALMIGGFGMAGAALRRRRTAPAA